MRRSLILMRDLKVSPSVLQNHEATLRDFGLNNRFPIVWKRLLSHSFAHIQGKNRRGGFSRSYNISPLIGFRREILREGADCLPQPLPQADGAFSVSEPLFIQRSEHHFLVPSARDMPSARYVLHDISSIRYVPPCGTLR